jgi:3',5'-cyclic AMP phosphodiesterase CpdA
MPHAYWPFPALGVACLGVLVAALERRGEAPLARRSARLLPIVAGMSAFLFFTLVVARAEHRFLLLIHHPPIPGVNRFRRLHDAPELREVLRKHGAELVLHGHLHENSLIWLSGPREGIPCIGAPSASGSPHYKDDPAGYNLFEIDGEPGDWHCMMVTRAMSRDDGTIGEVSRQFLT